MSNARRFRSVTDEKMHQLQQENIKKRTFVKLKWAVKAYSEWRANVLSDDKTFDGRVYDSDLKHVELLEKDSFEFSMCKFLAEVRKAKDGEEYPGKTLYHLVVSIQKYLVTKGKKWKLIESGEFSKLHNTLDNLMKERAGQNIGMVKRQASMISHELECKLWDNGTLGEANPDQLRSTVLFLLGMNLGLRAGDEHYALHRDTKEKPSQLSFCRNDKGVRCLVNHEDHVTKTNDGGLKHMRKECKVIWVYPSSDITHCSIHLVDKYVSLLPPPKNKTPKKANFYLRSLEKPSPAQWYGEQVVGLNTLKKVVQELLKDSDGFYTNHSLCRTGTTHLFRSGMDRKLVKEYSGHTSDAIDAYQITSDEQRETISRVISGPKEVTEQENQKCKGELAMSVCDKTANLVIGCQCKTQEIQLNQTEKIGELISKLVENRRNRKAKIKIEIEFCD